MTRHSFAWILIAVTSSTLACAQTAGTPATIDLSTSKQLHTAGLQPAQKTNSLPVSMAASPDGRWVVLLNAGYGTLASAYQQSIAVVDTASGKLTDFPDARTLVQAKQTFFSGIAFSADGAHVYAGLASMTDPEGTAPDSTGSGIARYAFHDGALRPDGFFKLPLVALAAGRKTLLHAANPQTGVPYPSAIAVLPSKDGVERLLVAENLSDSVALLNTATGKVERRFDLSSTEAVPSTYPIAVAVTADGRRAFVALWNASEVAELDLAHGTVARRVVLLKPKLATAAGTHPCALLLDEHAGLLYVALSNRDAVAAVRIGRAHETAQLTTAGFFDTRLPGQGYFGAEPNALALNADGTRLYAANMGTNSIAVLATRKLRSMQQGKGMLEPIGFVPTELMPVSLASVGGKLYVATDKGRGTGPNNMPATPTPPTDKMAAFHRPFTYIATLLAGSVATLDERAIEGTLAPSTRDVVASNRIAANSMTIPFARGSNPIRHVIYIIRENRTYDQILGDLKEDGKPVGNGDPSLTMYGEDTTPNVHKLALQFGVLDNFYDSAEVSGDGHVWSNAAIGTDYLERTWQQSYRGRERTYDYEGMVADGYPLLQHIPDVNEAPSGYLWTNLAAHGKSLIHFGEYISSTFCDDKKATAKPAINPQEGAMSGGVTACPTAAIAPGAVLPEEWGGGKNLWPWAIPRLASNTATKPELVGHFVPEMPDFNLRVPDQIRADIFLRHLKQWEQDRAAGHDTMPSFVMLRIANDHTEGTRAGGPTPKASIADNDLAIGRAVEAVSHSAYWADTAFFILEDDAQNGGDHVDAHRSVAFVVSKYAPHAPAGQGAFVDSSFYTTVSVVRTMEALLGVPPMNVNDAFAPSIASLLSGPGDQPAFTADVRNRDNGLIYTANKPTARGAAASAKMDFRHADRADARKLNLVLWEDAMGDAPVPELLLRKPAHKKDDDDD